ncbi:MAG: TIGR01777 family oxidoreductase [Pirellulales bacterium]
MPATTVRPESGEFQAQPTPADSSNGARTVLVTGASGLVGQALLPRLEAAGYRTRAMRRGRCTGSDICWSPDTGVADKSQLEGAGAVVHLAGENIAAGRWNAAKKQRIRDSRVQGTQRLCESLAALKSPPQTLICASATGFYGNRGTEELTEDSPAGSGFLSDVCVEWERAARPAVERGIRVVHLRIGVILTPAGGALQKMLLPFKLGVGGVVGSGSQYWSWVSLDDVVGAIAHCLAHDEISGPVNAVAPSPVTNREFTKALGKALHRPTIFPMPAFAARLALGEMSDALLMASTRVLPTKLEASGYHFRHADLSSAFHDMLGK